MMKQFSVEMPQVRHCELTNCAYNVQDACHAKAITVGHGDTPMCDTFLEASPHSKRKKNAGVGACKVSVCSYNSDYECQASDITIAMENNSAMCVTFTR